VCVRACDKDGRWLLCACKACRKFASSTRNDKKPVEKNEKKEMRRRKGSCSTHRNELQSCSKLFFCFGATALCNRAKGWVGVYLRLPLRLVPSRSGTHMLGVKTMWLLSPLCRTPRGNLANALAINCNIWAISIWLRFIWPKSRSATPFTLFYPPPLRISSM